MMNNAVTQAAVDGVRALQQIDADICFLQVSFEFDSKCIDICGYIWNIGNERVLGELSGERIAKCVSVFAVPFG